MSENINGGLVPKQLDQLSKLFSKGCRIYDLVWMVEIS